MDANSFKTIEQIVEAIRDAGYDPYTQLHGYLSTGVDAYITRKGDARNLVKLVDPEQLLRYIETNLKSK